MPYVNKPGFGQRAFVAFALLDCFAGCVLLVLLYLLRPYLDYWYVILPITLGFMISQVAILDATIWPVLKDWIEQRTYVSDKE